MRRLATWLATALIGVTTLAACGAGSEDASNPSDTFVFGSALGPRTWDPHTEGRAYAYGWYSLVYDGLVSTDASGEIVPGLATDWKQSSDRLEMTLAEDVTFADGAKFDADAVKWNIAKQKEQVGTAAIVQDISNVEVTAPNKVVLRLAKPVPDLLTQLAGFPGLMVSPKVKQADLEAGQPAGTGPYVLDLQESQKDTQYTFVPNESSWLADTAHFEKVVGVISADAVSRSNAVRSGRVDVAHVTPLQADALSDTFEVTSGIANIAAFIVLDVGGKKLPALAEAKVRQALALAIDREAFVKTVNAGYGTPTDQLFADGLGHVDGYAAPARDVERARQLIKDSGVGKVKISTGTGGTFTVGNEALKSMFAEIDVDLELVAVPDAEIISGIIGGDFDAIYTYIPHPHPQSVYNTYLSPTAPYNPFKYADPEVQSLVAKAVATERGSEAEVAAYADLMRYVYESGWIVPIAENANLIAYSTDKVKDVVAWKGVIGFPYLRDIKPA